MSMPATLLDCEKCGYGGSASVTRGDFRYQIGGSEYPVSRKLAWCLDCSGFVPAEDFESYEEQNYSREDTLSAPVGGIFNRLFSVRKRRIEKTPIVAAAKPKRPPMQARPERCLSCGGINFLDVDIDHEKLDPFAPEQPPLRTGFIHPQCGGEFLASLSQGWFNVRFEPKYFDSDGMPIENF